MENIRAYNMMFAMTSFGAKVDDSVNNGSGPYVFKVEGQISHWMGTLCPPIDHNPRFLQMYIYDTKNEVCNRLRYFSGPGKGNLKPEIVKTLIKIFDEANKLVKLFRTARDMCLHEQHPEFMVRLYNSGNHMRYNSPAPGVLGAIVYDNGPNNLYFINAHMADDTAQAKIVFFDAAATMLLQTDCNTMIEQLGYSDPYTLPAPVSILKGQTKIFQVHFTRFCKPGAIDFVADAVFEDAIILDKGSHIQTLNPANPATPTRIGHGHLTSTPITPATNPTTESSETKHHEQTSAKKQLFQTSSGQTDAQPVKKQKNCVDPSDENIKK